METVSGSGGVVSVGRGVSGGNVDGWVATVALTVGEGLGTGLSAQPQGVQARKMAGMIRFRIFNSPPPGNHSILSNYSMAYRGKSMW